MTTPSADSDNPAPQPRRSIVSILGTALLGAVLGGIAMPFVTFFAAMILAGLTTDCSNDSGGCAMWAGSVTIASVPAWAAIFFALGLYSGLKSR
jgi:hypothetical protein